MTFAHLCSVEGENRIDETLKLLIELAEQKRHRRHAAAAGGNLIVKDVMQLAMVGSGRIGANMARRLITGGYQCVLFDMSLKASQICFAKPLGAAELGH